MNMLLIGLTLLLSTSLPARAQEAAANAPVPVGDLVVSLIPHSDEVSVDVVQSVIELYRREVEVESPDGHTTSTWNISLSDDGWLVIDTAPRVEAVKLAVAKLTASLAKPQVAAPASELVIETYVPRFVDVERLYELLFPLQRVIHDQPSARRAPGEARPNVTYQDSPSLLVMQDTAEQVARMKALLSQVDQAAPQMLLTCWLVSEGDHGGTELGAPLPPELAENLQRLLPWSEPRAMASAMLRLSVVAGDERKLQGQYLDADGNTEQFQLFFQPAGVDESGRQLALQRVGFHSSDGLGFETSAVLAVGEYTVLGMSGDRPLLVALRAVPLDH
ncbi:MAG: hypothetical protein FJ296_05280 [Planctomycetes bacterium]|nr:hypothetical protein [Planctomycetota bacterium]